MSRDRPTSPALDQEQREILADLIVRERERLTGQASAMRQTFDELVAAADLEPPDDEHDPDGTTAYERAQVTSLMAASEHGITALDDALRRLVDGTYGVCSTCGAPIPFERLAAVPGTDRCVACASGGR